MVTERAQATAPTAEEADDLQRRAVAGALEACGYLTREEVRRAPRPRKRQRRESLERRLRQFREQPTEMIEQPAKTIGQPASEPSVLRLDTGPPDTTAQRERSNSIWWRKPITLLLTLTKAAKISH